MTLLQIKIMLALVYGETTTTYTSTVMSDTYEACRTKWRMLTCAYWLPPILDAERSVDMSIMYLV